MQIRDLTYVVVLGICLGLGSAYAALNSHFPFEATQIGVWRAWPKTGSRQIDPYARAILGRGAYLPLGVGEGLAFVADRDDAGRYLDSACRYELTGRVPPARGWSLNRVIPAGAAEEDVRTGFADSEIVRAEDRTFTIALSSAAAGGNWLPLSKQGHFSLILRLYDTPVSSTAHDINASLMPVIRRTGCGA